MEFVALSVILQIALIVHVLRTGRPAFWVFVILIAPGIGSLAYFIVELLPELSGSVSTKRAVRSVRKTFDPRAGLRQRELEHRLSGSVDAARRLAQELVDSGRFKEAITHYEGALTGLYEHDPDLLLGLATAQFGDGQHAAARESLDRLMKHNPEFRSSDGHLLYARAVEACGDDEKALEEYAAVAAYYAGAEAKLRYGLLLEKLGRGEDAIEQFEEIVSTAELAPRHYRKAQRDWVNAAKEGIRRVGAQ